MLENQVPLPALIGEKVLWLGSGSGQPKSGKVLWIGRLAEISDKDWTLGLELDESLPVGGIDGRWSGRKLFDCKPKHGLLVPADSILPAKEAGSLLKDSCQNDAEDDLSTSDTSKEVTRYLEQDNFCGSLYSYVKPKPAVRKKHQQCIKSDRNNNTHHETILENDSVARSVSLMSRSDFPSPVIPPRSKDVVKFCKLFGYSEPTNIIIDDRHFQLYNEVKKGNAVLNFSTQIEGNQNGVRIRKTMSAYYGSDEPDIIENNETKRVSSLKSVKRLFSKSSASQTSISAISSTGSDCSTQEKRLSGLFSFFRWFNKDKRKSNPPLGDGCPSEPASPQFKRTPVNYTGSVDSVYSTATCNSFFYVPPSSYKSKLCNQRRIALESDTDTYRNRVRHFERSREADQNISLRKKYKLLGSALTLHSSVDNISLCDRNRLGSSLRLSSQNSTLNRRKRQAPPPPPVIREVSPNPAQDLSASSLVSENQWKNHRRSSSESSKDKKAGAYFHVKGKRKAPPPPAFANRNKTLPRNLTIGSLRKKRAAPQPPKRNSAIFPSTSYAVNDFSEPTGVTEDLEVPSKPQEETVRLTELSEVSVEKTESASKLLVEECASETIFKKASDVSETSKEKPIGLLSKAEKQKLLEDFEKLQAHNKKHFTACENSSGDKMAQSVCNDSLKLEKGFLKPNKLNPEAGSKSEDKVVPPPSPVSPRPWYKRTTHSTSISQGTNKSILVEKLKNLEKNKEEPGESNDLPEVSSARKIRAPNDTSVLSFLSGSNAPSNENKRRSQLSILTNISELDREAAEIVRNERLRTSRLVSVENEKFYDSKLELPSYNQSETPSTSTSSSHKKTSARDLISLFNAISNVTKVTVNTAFFTRDSLNLFSKDSSDKKATSLSKSKKMADKKKSPLSEPTSSFPVPEQQSDLDDNIFINLHALDDIKPSLNESKNLCEEVMTEFDLRKSRTQELFEVNRTRRHRSPSPSFPTITEMSESLSGSTATSPVVSTVEDIPSPPPQTTTLAEATRADVSSASSYNAVWSCPRCTLENPMWRILCDACHLFRTTIAVTPIEPPVTKRVDLSLPPLTTTSSTVAVPTSIISSGSTENTQASGSNKPSLAGNHEEQVSNNCLELSQASKLTPPKEDSSSPVVEAPSINFEEAKMKFSRLDNKVVCRKIPAEISKKSLTSKVNGGIQAECGSFSGNYSENRKVELLKVDADSENIRDIPPSTSVIDDTIINTNTREEKLIRDKIVPSNDEELMEVRKARLAFFDKRVTENNLNKKLDDSTDSGKSNKEMDHAEREKLKLMLREMKHSLARQESVEGKEEAAGTSSTVAAPPDEKRFGAIKKVKKVDLDSKKLSYKKVSDYLDGMEKEKVAEVYLVTSDVIFEDIKIKAEPSTSSDKVSTSVQTTSVVRKTDLPPNIFSKPPTSGGSGQKQTTTIVAPVIVEEYNIRNGKVRSSVRRDQKPISIGAFELIRAKDFAGLKESKTQNQSPVYANIPSDASVSDYSQISDQTPSKSSDLSPSKPESFDFSASSSITTSNNVSQPAFENVTTLAINRLLRRLEAAIAKGQHHQAAALAKELARLKISCSVVRQKPCGESASNPITVNLFVEDKVAHQGPFPLTVDPEMKVADLKLKVDAELEVPVRFQRWILGKQLVTDDSRTLRQLGVDSPGCPFFLYLVAPDSSKPESPKSSFSDQKLFNVPQESATIASAPLLTSSSSEVEDFSLHENTISGISNILEEVVEENVSEDIDNADASLIENDKQLPEPEPSSSRKEDNVSPVGWKCVTCTLVNASGNSSCALCTNVRPGDRQLPQAHPNLNAVDEVAILKTTEEAAVSAEVKLSNYHELLNLDKSDLIPNVDEFECPVCLSVCKSREGVVLRECLHTFCKGCLAQMVEFSEEPEVKCPFQDSSYSCDSVLQEREIKALVTVEQYELHLAKSIAQAETKIGNTFHCKTPDCRGWCIFEDNVNYFLCPVCNRNNCLTCQAIHSGINCKQYQEQMREESETNVDAKRTRDMLEEMVERGEALACPSCQVVLMKKWGCDWVRCSMCKTEICWVRRCARWGPKGRGDTSGGCQCGVNGVKCHPKCTYCH